MKVYISIIAISLTFFVSCKKGFLEKYPEDRLVDETYWNNEDNVRTFAWGFYTAYFTGYGSGYAWGRYFSGQSLNDDFAPSSPAQFTRVVPASGGAWSFTYVRKANLLINRVQKVPMGDAAKAHWTGIGKFFRAMEYTDLAKAYGAVPWYDTLLTESDTTNTQLYKERDPLPFVVDKILEDFKYAAENVRASDGTAGVTVNRNVVLAFMSRSMLYFGTLFKYHGFDAAKSKSYLEAAKWAAEQVIASGSYTVSDNYRSLFNSLDLNGKKEIILYRRYEPGIITHSLHSYVNKEPQTGLSKDFIESYLMNDGLPITVSPKYAGDKKIDSVMKNRDGRIYETVASQLRLNGVASNYSTSGYATIKFYNEALKDLPEGSSNLNITDAPVIRYGEVLMNYAEATAELGTLSQADLDKSINVLRKRPGINMPSLQVIGTSPAVNGVVYDDPERDKTVTALIWEIRRERRIELALEGFRLDDLKRWKKLEYTTTTGSDINRGAWIKKSDYTGLKDIYLENNASEGYIIPAWKPESQRIFSDPKVYLEPIPLDQITLYNGRLTQNPGWQ